MNSLMTFLVMIKPCGFFFLFSYNIIGEKSMNNLFFGNTKIIDIQDKYYYNIYHLKGAVNIPYEELMNNYRYHLNKKDNYLIYCKSGKLSKRVVAVLSYLGYNVREYK